MDTYLRTDRATKKGTFKSKETIYIKQTGTNIVSNLISNNGNLIINSKGSIISVGSQIYADNNINLNATDGNILLTSANNSEITETQHDKTTITTGVKVGNAYVDAGGSAGNNADIKGANMLAQVIVSNHSLFRVESNKQSSFGVGQNNNLNKRNINNSQPASSDIYIINNINIYLNNTIYTKLGTIIIKPSYQKGLKWFNSKKDENHNSTLKTEPRLQYDLIKFYAYYNIRLNLPLFIKTQVIDPETNQPVMVKKRN